MKKLVILFILLLGLAVPMLAQDIEPPTDIWGAVINFKFLINSFAGASALLFFLIPTVLGVLRVTGKFLKYLFSILVIAGVTLAASLLDFGFLHGLTWWASVVSGAMLFMVHLGFFSWEFAKDIQDKIFEKWNPRSK